MQTLERTVPPEAAGQRLDRFLSEACEGLTRSALQNLIEEERVQVNGSCVPKRYKMRAGDRVTVEVPDPQPIEAAPQNIPLDIVYEDADLLVVNKPKGMVVHPAPGNPDGTLVNALLYHCAGQLSGIGGAIRPGIVHRIDKDTSGLLVVAKNDRAHVELSRQIAEKTCHRIYVALLEGIVKQDEGVIATDIGRNPADRLKMAVLPAGKGKAARTDYRVLERFFQSGYTLCEFSLHTGRTHQIRVHAQYISHPVVGDPVYGYKKNKFNLNGQLLHACKLILRHPRTGEEMTFEAPLPGYFRDVLSALEKREQGSKQSGGMPALNG